MRSGSFNNLNINIFPTTEFDKQLTCIDSHIVSRVGIWRKVRIKSTSIIFFYFDSTLKRVHWENAITKKKKIREKLVDLDLPRNSEEVSRVVLPPSTQLVSFPLCLSSSLLEFHLFYCVSTRETLYFNMALFQIPVRYLEQGCSSSWDPACWWIIVYLDNLLMHFDSSELNP